MEYSDLKPTKLRTYTFAAGSILCLLALSLACAKAISYNDPEGPVYTANLFESPAGPVSVIKVVSFNVKLGEELSRTIHLLDTAAELNQADILLLQEMDLPGVEALARELRFNYFYCPAAKHFKHGRDFGNAILSKWPIKNSRKLLLPHENPVRKQRRVAAVAAITVGVTEVQVYCTHTEMFHLNRQKRIDQIEAIVGSIDSLVAPVIVGGDLNTIRPSTLKAMDEVFATAGLMRATDDLGWTSKVGPFGMFRLSLDHIYTRGMQVRAKGKIPDSEASDHIPIWVDLELPSHDPGAVTGE